MARSERAKRIGSEGQGGARVLVETGFYEGLEWPLSGPRLVVGRGREADLVLSEPTISRTHAAVERVGEEWFVADLNSTNGTVVNGSRKTRAKLGEGDEIQLGRLVLRVRFGEEEAEEVVIG